MQKFPKTKKYNYEFYVEKSKRTNICFQTLFLNIFFIIISLALYFIFYFLYFMQYIWEKT